MKNIFPLLLALAPHYLSAMEQETGHIILHRLNYKSSCKIALTAQNYDKTLGDLLETEPFKDHYVIASGKILDSHSSLKALSLLTQRIQTILIKKARVAKSSSVTAEEFMAHPPKGIPADAFKDVLVK